MKRKYIFILLMIPLIVILVVLGFTLDKESTEQFDFSLPKETKEGYTLIGDQYIINFADISDSSFNYMNINYKYNNKKFYINDKEVLDNTLLARKFNYYDDKVYFSFIKDESPLILIYDLKNDKTSIIDTIGGFYFDFDELGPDYTSDSVCLNMTRIKDGYIEVKGNKFKIEASPISDSSYVKQYACVDLNTLKISEVISGLTKESYLATN